MQIKRKFIYTELEYLDKDKVEKSDDYWGTYNEGDFRYARIGIKGCYGEDLMLQAYIKLLPAQFTPTISEMTRNEFYGDDQATDLVNLSGKLDVGKVNQDLFLANKYQKAEGKVNELDLYEPAKGNIEDAQEIFKINFSSSTTSTNIIQSKVKIDGAFSARAVQIHSTVDLTNNQKANFYNLPLGNLSVSENKLYLQVRGNYVTAPEGTIEIEVKESSEENE